MRLARLTFDLEFITETCYSCGIHFALPLDLQRSLVQSRRQFFCPNGHIQNYIGKTDAEIAREERDKVQARLNEEQHARLVAEKKQREAEEKVSSLIARASRGICPCCNRTFSHSRLATHMKAKHPNQIPDGNRREIAA